MSASPARRAAREALTRVRESSSFAHEVLSSTLARTSLAPNDAAFATRLTYGALQMEGTLDEAIDRHLAGKRIEPRVRDALRVATYEILFLHTDDRASVHQGVELVRAVRAQAAGLANAVLRRVAADASTFPWGDSETDTAALARRFGHPLWLAELWVAELGRETAAAVMDADNEPAPLFLAVNPFVADEESATAALESDGAKPAAFAIQGCLIARDAASAVRGSALRDGSVIVADAAAQFVATIVRAKPGQTVVEVGAGRGTKTVLIQGRAVAAGGPANLVTVDLHEFKTALLRERVAGYGVPGVTTLTGDATDLESVEGAPAQRAADAVLVDAPCSGLGTLRRHPEKRWRIGSGEMKQLAELGQRLLASAAVLVRPGGFVVYSTCTLADLENGSVVRAFLASELGREFSPDPLGGEVPDEWQHFVTPEGFFQSLPESGGADGHFVARLKRSG
jgi:16S rRNA (cytosine967-C5)-methyltransferase